MTLYTQNQVSLPCIVTLDSHLHQNGKLHHEREGSRFNILPDEG